MTRTQVATVATPTNTRTTGLAPYRGALPVPVTEPDERLHAIAERRNPTPARETRRVDVRVISGPGGPSVLSVTPGGERELSTTNLPADAMAEAGRIFAAHGITIPGWRCVVDGMHLAVKVAVPVSPPDALADLLPDAADWAFDDAAAAALADYRP